MAKKLKPVVNYHPSDLVVVKTINWDDSVKYEVGMITNVHYPTQLTHKSYDIRTEGGAGLIYVPVDGNKKCKQYISSTITEAWISNGGTNNMWIHKRDGHTRANYSKDIKLRYDGQTKDTEGDLLVGQFEKYNNFVFPTQGPRSF
tara:strand:- start:404 stop:838 length:435 start_codon:yes stop_codon:yes gene_type:complete